MYLIWYILFEVIFNMGRYLANGILTTVNIKKIKGFSFDRDENFDLKAQLENILSDMNKYIDVSKYDIREENDEIVLNLKNDFVNDNIDDLLKEVNELTPCNHLFKPYFESREYPLLYKCEENDFHIIEYNGESVSRDFWIPCCAWILNDEYLFDNVAITVNFIPFWIDFDKYSGEDETRMLKIINSMKKSYYHSELSKVFIYEIYG